MRRPNRLVTVIFLAVGAVGARATAAQITVNCDRGQSLNRAVALLPAGTANTVTVNGRCTEYVSIRGQEDLTLRSRTGAVLVQPPVEPGRPCLFEAALTIDASRSITIDGLKVQASSTDVCSGGVLVRGGSTDVLLRNTAIEGGSQCVAVTANSQVSLAGVTGRDSTWAAVGVYDGSAVYVEDSQFEGSTEPGWHEGIVAIKGVAVVHGTRIRNMQVALDAGSGGVIDLANVADYYPTTGPSDVVVESPASTNFNGVSVSGGSSFNLNVTLRITGPGQPWGGETGGVRVSDASSFNGGADGRLEILASQGQGVVVTNNSFANLAGASITGTSRGGLVVINNSSANLDAWYAPVTTITGSSGPDLFCDATSLITGADKASSSTQQCDHVVGGTSVPLP